ncbi:hypothetical protein FN846DRAFT_922368 [Sphaerosporella brunnea]|uniref:U6 small nuclear RNA (adenine-(43)-N(6))-methyltransferase n=1 Tax=Sphaerosporella brunnea TaxID=1250544 RepID=A0A5J5EK69_9PEZI|nr:hypothetical protein FN846DRAFT_922368 [Sphaerosporella brunnea]
MHPRSPYASYLDFKKLAKDCPAFAPFVDSNANVNFKDPAAVRYSLLYLVISILTEAGDNRELAKSLLLRDFGFAVDLPEDRLCPMIPNRLDYILWLQDLIDSTSSDLNSELDTSGEVTGLDVGTGASCIYPLLGCSLRPSWRFIASDIDEASLHSARNNIARNKVLLNGRIKLYESSVTGPLFPLEALDTESIDFTMCNPPFYSSADSLAESAAQKMLPPSSACTGTSTEMVYSPHGELGFARRMLAESLVLRTRVKWYSTLFGKLSSVSQFISSLREIHELEVSGNWAVAEMVQGTTKRWAVAWSFGDRRPSAAVAGSMKGCSPLTRPELEFTVPRSVGGVGEEVVVLLSGLELMHSKRDELGKEFYVEVKGNVWSRAARRAMARGAMALMLVDEDVKLGVLITLAEAGEDKTAINVRWKRGREGVLFESFCGMVKRKLQLEK